MIKSPVQLDRKVPFVNATFRYLSENAPYDEAIRLIEAAEYEHQMQILYSTGGFLQSGGYVFRSSKTIDIRRLFQQIDDDSSPEAYERFQNDYDYIEPERFFTNNNIIQNQLYPFLSATSLILEGMDFASEHLIIFNGKLIWPFSPYEWGKVMAGWANETNWNLPLTINKSIQKDSWDSSDFYWGLEGIIADYNLWARATQEILLAKSVKYF